MTDDIWANYAIKTDELIIAKSLVSTHQHLKQLNQIILVLRKSNRDLNIWPSHKE